MSLVGLLALAGCSTNSVSKPTTERPSAVITYAQSCQGIAPEVRPKTLILACGDGGFQAIYLHWTDWGTDRADGAGTITVNLCVPSCANGNFKDFPATVTLKTPHQFQGIEIFTEMYVTYTNSTPYGKRVETYRIGP